MDTPHPTGLQPGSSILVTGGAGYIGSVLVGQLLGRGFRVRTVDCLRYGGDALLPYTTHPRFEFVPGDIRRAEDVRTAVAGMDGIVHLAAIPYPGGAPGQEVFRASCAGTFNVYRAAADEGISRVSSASSINALGFNYGLKSFDIAYFPIDEEHATFTTDAYSFSKQVVEDIGDGHSFAIVMRDGFPINVLNAVKSCQEVCGIFCATANPVEVIVAETSQGSGILGVVDGAGPQGIEGADDVTKRKGFLRTIGYKR